MPKIKGSCLCGAVTYTMSHVPKILDTFWEHSKDSKTHSASAFSVFTAVPENSVLVNGPTKSYTHEDVERSFCEKCGSSIALFAAAFPELACIGVGTLKKKARGKFVADGEIRANAKSPWVKQKLGSQDQYRSYRPAIAKGQKDLILGIRC